MTLSPSVFKAYDIRGRFPDEFDAEGADRIVAAYATLLAREGATTIVLARDARVSSDALAKRARLALIAAGMRVLDIGLATTPLFYFAVNHFGADGGMMVTASHLPPPSNGFKLCRKEAMAIGEGSGMEEIRAMALAGQFQRQKGGSVSRFDALEPYLAFLETQVKLARPLTAVIDPANGMAGLILEKLLPRIAGLTVRRMHFDVDGTFPNHEANPLKDETLEDLRVELRRAPSDIGIAFDGDADRAGFLTSGGAFVSGHYVLALLAQHALRKTEGGARILYAANVSRIVPETIRAEGGEPIMTKIGHANINRAMRETGAVLGGELSGHFFFREFFGRDDAMIAMLRILSLVSETESFDALLAPLRRYVQSGEINFKVRDKAEALRLVEEAFHDGRISKLDGLTVDYADWWFNLRPSNTEDVVRLNVEATTPTVLHQKILALRRILTKEKRL